MSLKLFLLTSLNAKGCLNDLAPPHLLRQGTLGPSQSTYKVPHLFPEPYHLCFRSQHREVKSRTALAGFLDVCPKPAARLVASLSASLYVAFMSPGVSLSDSGYEIKLHWLKWPWDLLSSSLLSFWPTLGEMTAADPAALALIKVGEWPASDRCTDWTVTFIEVHSGFISVGAHRGTRPLWSSKGDEPEWGAIRR